MCRECCGVVMRILRYVHIVGINAAEAHQSRVRVHGEEETFVSEVLSPEKAREDSHPVPQEFQKSGVGVDQMSELRSAYGTGYLLSRALKRRV